MVKNLPGLILHMLSPDEWFLSINNLLHLIQQMHYLTMFSCTIRTLHRGIKRMFSMSLWTLVNINSNSEHAYALCWITVAIILHNLIIDVGGNFIGNQAGRQTERSLFS